MWIEKPIERHSPHFVSKIFPRTEAVQHGDSVQGCHSWLHENMKPKATPREQAELLQLAGPNKIYKDKKGRNSASAKIVKVGRKKKKKFKVTDIESRIELGRIISTLKKEGYGKPVVVFTGTS